MCVSTARSNGPVIGFDQPLPSSVTNEVLRPLIQWHLDQLSENGWYLGHFCVDCLRSNDWDALYRWDPDLIEATPDDHFHLGQIRAFFKKRVDLDLGIDRKAEALRKFWEAEQLCATTNEALYSHSRGWLQFHPDVESVLYGAKQKICDVLRDPAPLLSEVRPRFGPGSSTQTPKKNACAGVKLATLPACSANVPHQLLSEMLEPWISGYGPVPDAIRKVSVRIDPAVIQFVLKDLRALRVICKQPALNSLYQNGVGDLLADLLRKNARIDIRDQTRNQRAALLGSIRGRFATIDLSMASDTVAWRLVQHLFPSDWFDLLMAINTREAEVDGKVIWLEKFATMGDGTTFPVETLIFWALAQTATDLSGGGKALAYGDDIVVPTDAVPLLLRSLHALGFIANRAKSFWHGPFRESCGKDYSLGTDVRPNFVKGDELPGNKPGSPGAVFGSDFFKLHNFYVRRGLLEPARLVLQAIGSSCRLWGPDGYGDGHLLGAFIPKRSRGGEKKGFGGYNFETWSYSPQRVGDEVLSRFLGQDLPRVSSEEKSGLEARQQGYRTRVVDRKRGRSYEHFVFHGNRLAHAMRLATYSLYVREDARKGDALAGLLDPVDRSDSDFWVSPGKGPLRRTSVYTFEPGLFTVR